MVELWTKKLHIFNNPGQLNYIFLHSHLKKSAETKSLLMKDVIKFFTKRYNYKLVLEDVTKRTV